MLSSDTFNLTNVNLSGLTLPLTQVVPNPADEQLSIRWSNSNMVSEVRLIDPEGRHLPVGPVSPASVIVVDTRDLPEGNYIIQLLSTDGAVLVARRVTIVH
jgi:hypothetical protein